MEYELGRTEKMERIKLLKEQQSEREVELICRLSEYHETVPWNFSDLNSLYVEISSNRRFITGQLLVKEGICESKE